jgi:ankyrin repeat protein
LLLCSKPHLVNSPLDDVHTTLLHLAANSRMPAILQLLVSHGAEVDWQNEEGMSALHVAAMWGNVAAVRLLLDSGADPVVVDEEDRTPLDHAQGQGECWVSAV